MSACNDRDSSRDVTYSPPRYGSPLRSQNDSFSVHSIQSSAKKVGHSTFLGGIIPFNLDKADKSSYSSASADLIQSKIEHLEKERVELTLQLHMKDEKDRDRKFKLEQMEYKLKAAEEEKNLASTEMLEYRDMVYKLEGEKKDLVQQVQKLQKEVQNTNRCEAMDVWKKMAATSKELKRVEEEYAVLSQEKMHWLDEKDKSEKKIRLLSEENTDNLARYEVVKDELRSEKERGVQLLQMNEQLEQKLEDMLQYSSSQKTEYLNRISELEQHISALDEKLAGQEEVMCAEKKEVVADGEAEATIQELKTKLLESEKARRALHNQVQDLKGHIRVFVRCRPFLSSDHVSKEEDSLVVLHQDHSSITLNSLTGRAAAHNFTFDQTFASESSQSEVFAEVSGLVQSVLDGFRVCVFSYGQTGSGKTHTMTGAMQGEHRGIIPRAVEQLLTQAREMSESGWVVQMSLTCLEIYNEEIRDLLGGYPSCPSSINGSYGSNKIKVFRNPQTNRIVLQGATTHELNCKEREGLDTSYSSSSSSPENGPPASFQEFKKLFDFAVQARSTAHTGMNSVSSRSHFIVMIDVSATSPQTPQAPAVTLQGGLRLCDLAGSERLDRTNTLTDAARLKETQHINKSLSCLADVFLALHNKNSHVPYRNSKLTSLLQDCLSGDGKAMMFVNISPTSASLQETLCSLRFANQVSQVELGKAQKSIFAAPSVPPVPPSVSSFLPPTVPSFMPSSQSTYYSASLVDQNDPNTSADISIEEPSLSPTKKNSPLPSHPLNRPLPLHSFLSQGPARPGQVVSSTKPLAPGSSRRTSLVMPNGSTVMNKQIAPTALDVIKENEVNARPVTRALLAGPQVKRDISSMNCESILSSKRPKTAYESNATAAATRKVTWR